MRGWRSASTRWRTGCPRPRPTTPSAAKMHAYAFSPCRNLRTNGGRRPRLGAVSTRICAENAAPLVHTNTCSTRPCSALGRSRALTRPSWSACKPMRSRRRAKANRRPAGPIPMSGMKRDSPPLPKKSSTQIIRHVSARRSSHSLAALHSLAR